MQVTLGGFAELPGAVNSNGVMRKPGREGDPMAMLYSSARHADPLPRGRPSSSEPSTSTPFSLSCSHPVTLASLASDLQAQLTVDLETVLSRGEYCTAEVRNALNCRFCTGSARTIAMLPHILHAVLVLYEACCEAYTFSLPTGADPMDGRSNRLHGHSASDDETSSRASSHSDGNIMACRRSNISLGQMSLPADDSKLLVKVVLLNRLRHIGGQLERLREMLPEILLDLTTSINGQDTSVASCEESIASCEDKLYALIGLLD